MSPPNSCPPSISECDLSWKPCLCRCDLLQWGHTGLEWTLIWWWWALYKKRKPDTKTHRVEGNGSRDWRDKLQAKDHWGLPVTTRSWCEGPTPWKRSWCWERLRAGAEGGDRGWDGWMASPTQQMWVWACSGSWWWPAKPDVLQSMGSQRVGHDWVTGLNWAECSMALKMSLALFLGCYIS